MKRIVTLLLIVSLSAAVVAQIKPDFKPGKNRNVGQVIKKTGQDNLCIGAMQPNETVLSKSALSNVSLMQTVYDVPTNASTSERIYTKDSDVILVAYGSVARMAKASVEMARAKGLKVGLIRPITLWPFPVKAIEDACGTAGKFLVVEMSAGQMVEDVRLAVNGKAAVEFYGRMGGGVPSEEEIFRQIEALV